MNAIAQYLPENWIAVDLEGLNIDLKHAHPRGCPRQYKANNFNDGRGHIGDAIKFTMKGKF